jgi:hypothetical protein
MVAFEESLLVSETVRPPGGAGLARLTGIAAHSPIPTVTPVARLMPELLPAVTAAAALVTLGAEAEAVIVTCPAATAVIGTATLVAFAENVTDAGTIATAGLLLLRLTAKPPAGAGNERFRLMLLVPGAVTLIAAGEKLKAAPTFTS